MIGGEPVAAKPDARSAPGLHRIAVAVVAWGDVLARLSGLLSILCLAALLLLVLVQIAMGVLSPYFPAAASAMSVSWEYAGYLMGAAFMFGMPQTLRQGGHIRVNVLFDALTPRHRRIVDFFVSAASCVTMAILAHALSTMAIRAFATHSLSTASLTPLWIPQGALGLAAWLFTVQLLVRMVALLAGQAAEEARTYVGASPE